ncbi:hypothetical protein DPMN_008231 [Dreissena polymorpha]|uniref:Uncharacterized protein n=1 Tax=Dreissena polymorpha TaxID=45954 RepID=A0A9D4MYT8_DREPO|nr:hypothetical protein DPMN_008231 [Dreissena polymorpha]
MKEWFQRQELGLSQKETLKDNSNNARDNVMTSSIPGYQSGFLAASMDTGEKCNTLPFTRRKQLEDPRGRQANRPRGSLGYNLEPAKL